jgi:hypothetical protein
MKELMEWRLIKPKDTVRIKNFSESEAVVMDDKTVNFQGKTLSYYEWGKNVTGWSAMSVYEWIIVEGQTKTLHELRMEKMEELIEKEENTNL